MLLVVWFLFCWSHEDFVVLLYHRNSRMDFLSLEAKPSIKP